MKQVNVNRNIDRFLTSSNQITHWKTERQTRHHNGGLFTTWYACIQLHSELVISVLVLSTVKYAFEISSQSDFPNSRNKYTNAYFREGGSHAARISESALKLTTKLNFSKVQRKTKFETRTCISDVGKLRILWIENASYCP